MILSHYDAIYLSPHLDDAALSCGGQIFTQTTAGKSVLIVTIMAGDPPDGTLSDFARSLHAGWELARNVVATRRVEDVAACRTLGADYLHWAVPDCIYRRHPDSGRPLYPSWADVVGVIHPAELTLTDQLARQIAGLPAHDRLAVPLTAGGHVDHQLVRLAAERSPEPDLYYYEDYPYVRDAAALAALISAGDANWQAEVVPLGEAEMKARIEAVAAFVSQIGSLFNGRSDMEQQIQAYVQKVGGERLWHRRSELERFP